MTVSKIPIPDHYVALPDLDTNNMTCADCYTAQGEKSIQWAFCKNASDAPETGIMKFLMSCKYNAYYGFQYVYTSKIYRRTLSNATWGSWQEVG